MKINFAKIGNGNTRSIKAPKLTTAVIKGFAGSIPAGGLVYYSLIHKNIRKGGFIL